MTAVNIHATIIAEVEALDTAKVGVHNKTISVQFEAGLGSISLVNYGCTPQRWAESFRELADRVEQAANPDPDGDELAEVPA